LEVGYFSECEESVSGGFTLFDAQMLLDHLLDLLGATDHAGRGAT